MCSQEEIWRRIEVCRSAAGDLCLGEEKITEVVQGHFWGRGVLLQGDRTMPVCMVTEEGG